MSVSVGVIADDLTGAADTAVAFARPERPVGVLLNRADPAWPGTAHVGAIDADVRDAPPAVDVRAMYAELAARASRARHLYIKIDSTLRGQVSSAVAGVRDALPDHAMICAPAFPGTGRTVRNAVPYLDGTELHRSGAWHTEQRPVPRSLGDVLTGQSLRFCSLDEVRDGRLGDRLSAAADAGRLSVCDAVEDLDLRLVARAGLATARPMVWIGSAGLATAMAAELLGEHPTVGSQPEPGEPAVDSTHFLAVVGSAADIAQTQARELAAAGVRWFRVPRATLLRGDSAESQDISAMIARAAGKRHVVVSIAADGVRRGDRQENATVATSLARIVAPAAHAADLLLLTGGATARAVLDACSIKAISVVRTLVPGIVLATANGPLMPHLITKAGAFGDELTLVETLCSNTRRIGAL